MLLVIFLIFSNYLTAEEPQHEIAAKQEKNITFYAGINPLALIAFLPNGAGTFGTAWGIISGQEFGISLYGGIHLANSHSLETRFSTGPSDAVVWDTQLQLGYIWYPFEEFMNWNGGLSSGLILRQFFWNNRITEYTNFNLTPELFLGWRFVIKSLAFDVRAGWNLAAVTWSNMPNTKISTGWTPFPYNLTLTTGIAWIFN